MSKKKLNAKQLRSIELQVSTKMTIEEIADSVGVSPSTIYTWQRQPEYMEFREQRVRESISNAASLAVHALVELLESRNDGVRLGAAREILDRGGFKHPDKLDIKTIDNIKIDWK